MDTLRVLANRFLEYREKCRTELGGELDTLVGLEAKAEELMRWFDDHHNSEGKRERNLRTLMDEVIGIYGVNVSFVETVSVVAKYFFDHVVQVDDLESLERLTTRADRLMTEMAFPPEWCLKRDVTRSYQNPGTLQEIGATPGARVDSLRGCQMT